MFIITLCTLVAIYCVLGFRFLPKRPKNASIQWRAAPASPGSPGPYRQAGERSEEVPVPQKLPPESQDMLEFGAQFRHALEAICTIDSSNAELIARMALGSRNSDQAPMSQAPMSQYLLLPYKHALEAIVEIDRGSVAGRIAIKALRG